LTGKTGNLSRAKKKISHMYGKIWGGRLTPSEIFALIDAGVTPRTGQAIDYIKERKDHGNCKPSWFYFELRGNILGNITEEK